MELWRISWHRLPACEKTRCQTRCTSDKLASRDTIPRFASNLTKANSMSTPWCLMTIARPNDVIACDELTIRECGSSSRG
jgi:hypothetical protein